MLKTESFHDSVDLSKLEDVDVLHFIESGISLGIIRKWKLSNAIDMQLLEKLFMKPEATKFMTLAHCFPNWKVLEDFVNTSKDFNATVKEFDRHTYNTPEFHKEMTKVTSSYSLYGGFHPGDTTKGFAAQALDNIDFLVSIANAIDQWFQTNDVNTPDDLILLLPGHKDYWYLHFKRWLLYVKTIVYGKHVRNYPEYLEMEGCKLFYKEFYPGEFDVNIIKRLYDVLAITNSYAEFACLLCETYRMKNEMVKLKCQSLLTLKNVSSLELGTNASARDYVRACVSG